MITPSDSPSSPADYAGVATQGMNIQAPLQDGEIGAAFGRANRDGGAGFLYPQGERQAQAAQMLDSAAGFGLGGFDVDAGTTAGWPNNIEPAGM